jgi:hypothetical protein
MTEPDSSIGPAEAAQPGDSGAGSDLHGQGPETGVATEGANGSGEAPAYTFEDYLRDCLRGGRGGRKEDLERALRARPSGDRLVPAQTDSLILAFQEMDPQLRVLLDIGVQLTNVERGGAARMSFSGLAWDILRARPILGSYLADFDHLVDLQGVDLRRFFAGFARAQASGPEDSQLPDEEGGKTDRKTVLKNEAAVAGLCMVLEDFPMEAVVMGMARAATAGSRPRPPGEGVTAAAEWLQGKKIPRQLIGILEQLQASKERQAERDRAERETLQKRLDQLSAHIAGLQGEIAELASAGERLTAELEQERRRAKDQAIGLRHNLYSVTHAVLRALEDEVSPRLQESLKALSRDPPKTAVAIEYTGKAVDIVEEQIGCLKS